MSTIPTFIGTVADVDGAKTAGRTLFVSSSGTWGYRRELLIVATVLIARHTVTHSLFHMVAILMFPHLSHGLALYS